MGLVVFKKGYQLSVAESFLIPSLTALFIAFTVGDVKSPDDESGKKECWHDQAPYWLVTMVTLSKAGSLLSAL